jgi:hypothetical protein
MFNIICEQPETVAQALVPGLRTVKGTGKAVNYLTPPRIILAILNGWFRRGRWFDQEVGVHLFGGFSIDGLKKRSFCSYSSET